MPTPNLQLYEQQLEGWTAPVANVCLGRCVQPCVRAHSKEQEQKHSLSCSPLFATLRHQAQSQRAKGVAGVGDGCTVP